MSTGFLHCGSGATRITGPTNRLAFSPRTRTPNVLSPSCLSPCIQAHTSPSDYSYKEFQGVKIDTPGTDAKQQRVARTKIASYYGINPTQSKRQTRAPSWTHIPVPGTGEVEIPQNFKLIAGYRHLVVLHHRFTREDSSPCAACASRRANASIVRGVIYVPPNIVDEIIGDKIRSPNKAAANLITKSFQGKLLDLSGKVLAPAQGGEDVDMVPATERPTC
ncbi:hypothetical protein PAXINDRAFT_11406 [Paxillus involutus ATCC 200175]|uniref:Uncharacterized protein n=1 Tax=Paxillus involutus ATCC 200175 TaxID=664439 RepID=A0A0C9U8W6_PAXIN|nr:hypothetical protein PAXINDRAFT_11406 [Paxillus involutus ATCC 200175]